VKDLEARLAALDPDASAALRVIAYFDKLTEAGAGLQAIVRGAAVLAGCPARLADEERRLSVRVAPDGSQRGPASPPDRSWLSADVTPADVTPVGGAAAEGKPAGGAVLWLERPGPAGPVEAMVLERAAAAARVVITRTRGRAPDRARNDEAAVEVLIDGGAPAEARRHAAHALGLAEEPRLCAVALAEGTRIGPTIRAAAAAEGDATAGVGGGRRTGIGTAVTLEGLPASWAAAQIALRLTAEGTGEDPGPRSVRYEDLGALALLAEHVSATTPAIPDEIALDHAAAAAPWMLATLYAVATSASLRAAATELLVHHSTLQERIEHAERVLGWSIRHPHGRHRLYLALALRRLRRHLPRP
jgi:hypothetical protein